MKALIQCSSEIEGRTNGMRKQRTGLPSADDLTLYEIPLRVHRSFIKKTSCRSTLSLLDSESRVVYYFLTLNHFCNNYWNLHLRNGQVESLLTSGRVVELTS